MTPQPAPPAASAARPATGAVPIPAPSLAARARDVLGSEWIKFRSVRSTYWTLLIALVTPIAISAVVAVAFTAQPPPGHPGRLPDDPLLPGLISLEYAVLAIGVLGILAFTAEHASGLIRTTYAAVPRRRAVLAAKAAVIAAVTLPAGELVSFLSFFEVQAILAHHHGLSLGHPGAAGAVLAEGVLLTVCALLGLGIGALIRHTAGAIAAFVGVLVVPAALGLLPAPWNDRIGRFSLIDAAQQVAASHPRTGLFSPAWSLVVLIAWPTLALLAAAIQVTRRDA
jgi:ABC-2 type transport system permease protein